VRPAGQPVSILIEDDIDHPAREAAQLIELGGSEMRAQGGGGMAKTGLPQGRHIEQSFHQVHGGAVAHRVPGEQATLGARQEPMREGGSHTAAVEVHDGALPAEREDHPATERVATLGGDEAAFEQLIEAIAVVRQVAAQNTTGCVANAEFLNEGGIAQSTFLEILHGFRMAVELELVKGGGLFQHVGIDRRRELLLEIGDALAEGQIPGQLDQADQVAATAATVAVEQILVGIDVERRAGFRV
jgi:hypothetical protein